MVEPRRLQREKNGEKTGRDHEKSAYQSIPFLTQPKALTEIHHSEEDYGVRILTFSHESRSLGVPKAQSGQPRGQSAHRARESTIPPPTLPQTLSFF